MEELVIFDWSDGEFNMRAFNTGATRDAEGDKLDFEGFLNPLVVERYAQFLHKHRKLADGSMRDADNWQLGMPLSVYLKSMWRHFMAVWKWHRGYEAEESLEDALCAVMFNAQGYLLEVLKKKKQRREIPDSAVVVPTDS
jgi:hypothetical protein